jgi:hypothetical protein
MLLDQFKKAEQLLHVGRVEAGVGFIKVAFPFLKEIFVFPGQRHGPFKIFGIMLLEPDGDLKFLVCLARIENILQFFFLDLLPGIHFWIIVQPGPQVKPKGTCRLEKPFIRYAIFPSSPEAEPLY